MGGRGPRFSPGTEVIDRLVAQAVVLEDAKGAQTLWLSIDMIGMAWPQTSGFRQELSAMTGIPFNAIVINFSLLSPTSQCIQKKCQFLAKNYVL